MTTHSTDHYLESQVRTATPQRLRLMMIDAAVRHASQALQRWSQPLPDDCRDALARCRQLVAALTPRRDVEDDPTIEQVTAVYLFLFRTLSEAQVHENRERVTEALRILREEQETWRQYCEAHPEPPDLAAAGRPRETTARQAAAILLQNDKQSGRRDDNAYGTTPAIGPTDAAPGGAFSIDA